MQKNKKASQNKKPFNTFRGLKKKSKENREDTPEHTAAILLNTEWSNS